MGKMGKEAGNFCSRNIMEWEVTHIKDGCLTAVGDEILGKDFKEDI